MNEGIVVKSHAGQKYTSDGVSIAIFRDICKKVNVPIQFFANRSDMEGGSTLGNIAMSQVSMNAIDIGLPQLAMHSAYETAGVKDYYYMMKQCHLVSVVYLKWLAIKKSKICFNRLLNIFVLIFQIIPFIRILISKETESSQPKNLSLFSHRKKS